LSVAGGHDRRHVGGQLRRRDRQGGMIGRPARAVDARLQPHLLHLLHLLL
jgi:hypothetical protein